MRTAGLIGIVLALAATSYLYRAATTRAGLDATRSPQEQVDVVSIRTALLEIGQAQRRYLLEHGTYGTLEELRADGPPALGAERRGYVFEVIPHGSQGFTATASPVDPDRPGWPTLTLDESMEVWSR
jgi:hypothetical protein